MGNFKNKHTSVLVNCSHLMHKEKKGGTTVAYVHCPTSEHNNANLLKFISLRVNIY